jgi:serralysin
MKRILLLSTMMAVTLVVASGAALAVVLVGTNGDDRLEGTNGSDVLSGRGGDDVLLGYEGADAMSGGTGRDAVLGGNDIGPQIGDRALAGGPGGDFVGGGQGSDGLSGGLGRDYMFAGPPYEGAQDVDAVSAGDDDDAVNALNWTPATDTIACGDGFDRVLVDERDVVAGDCERKFFSVRPFFASIDEAYYFAPLP